MNTERIFAEEHADELTEDELPDWVVEHSVTCAICGDLADERRTVTLWPDRQGHYGQQAEILRAVEEFGNGEAHMHCYDRHAPKKTSVRLDVLGDAIRLIERFVDGDHLSGEEVTYAKQDLERLVEEVGVDPRNDEQ